MHEFISVQLYNLLQSNIQLYFCYVTCIHACVHVMYVLLKAVLPVCMKYTAQDESRVANIA